MYELELPRLPFRRETAVAANWVDHSVHLLHLLLLVASRPLFALEKLLAVLIELEGGDLAVGGVDGHLRLLTVHLLFNHLVDVDAPSSAVNALYLAFTALPLSALHLNAVALAYGDGADIILLLEVFGQAAREELSADGGRSGEVRLSRFASLAGDTYKHRTLSNQRPRKTRHLLE